MRLQATMRACTIGRTRSASKAVHACIGQPRPPVRLGRSPCKWSPAQDKIHNCRSVGAIQARSRPLRISIRAALPDGPASQPTSYTPFSAELLLAVARLGHLERYRVEVKQLHEPGAPADLTRCALLITNIFDPQLDHRPYYTRLEDMVARAALVTLQAFSTEPEAPGSTTPSSSSAAEYQPGSTVLSTSPEDALVGFNGLDPAQPQHLLRAIGAINRVLFDEEYLSDNTADPYDPLNGSLADVLDRRIGNQYTLALIYLHVANGLGLPCGVVGSPEHILVRVGQLSRKCSSSSGDEVTAAAGSGAGAVFLVDVANGGVVYNWPMRASPRESGASSAVSSSRAQHTPAPLDPMDMVRDMDDEWNQALHNWLSEQQSDESHPTSATSPNSSSSSSSSSSGNDGKSMSSHMASNSSSGAHDHSFDEASVLRDSGSEDCGEASSSLLHGWQEVDSYSAEDAASRNSWKALYGTGALAEWGGTVSSSSGISSGGSSFSPQHPEHDSWEARDEGISGDGAGLEGFAAKSWFGIVDSPFAAAAGMPFPVDEEEPAGAVDNASVRAVTDSMDTCCSTDSDAVTDDVTAAEYIMGSTSSSSSSAIGASSSAAAAGEVVLRLSEEEVVLAYGSLQQVSSRGLLQRVLGGMKLSLMMSGREEEGLSVIRYLRATDPFSLPDLRDEGLSLANMAQHEPAAALLREYLAVAPGAPDADMVGEVLEQVKLAAQLARNRARRQQQ